jgi:hypothetical protein
MADERNVVFVLDSHDPDKLSIVFQPPENNPSRNFTHEFFKGHVWFIPTVFRYDPFICLSGIIDDLKYSVEIRFLTSPYHLYPPDRFVLQLKQWVEMCKKRIRMNAIDGQYHCHKYFRKTSPFAEVSGLSRGHYREIRFGSSSRNRYETTPAVFVVCL